MSEENTSQLSYDAKLIVASNMVVAQAILESSAAQRRGTPAIPIDKRVRGLIKGALDRLGELDQE